MSPRWKAQAQRIDALSLRERAIMFVSTALALAAVVDALVVSPALKERRQLAEQSLQRTRELAWMSPVGGAGLLVAADLAARMVVAPMEMPVGAVMALIGAPLFIGFLMRSGR